MAVCGAVGSAGGFVTICSCYVAVWFNRVTTALLANEPFQAIVAWACAGQVDFRAGVGLVLQLVVPLPVDKLCLQR